jgi:hypothetical protein
MTREDHARKRQIRDRMAATGEPYSVAARHVDQASQDSDPAEIVIVDITPTHSQGFGGHEFEYQPESDLFRCVRCGRYEVSVRDPQTGEIAACEAAQTDPETLADQMLAALAEAGEAAELGDVDEGVVDISLDRRGWADGPLGEWEEVRLAWREHQGWSLVVSRPKPWTGDQERYVSDLHGDPTDLAAEVARRSAAMSSNVLRVGSPAYQPTHHSPAVSPPVVTRSTVGLAHESDTRPGVRHPCA